ncbi:Chup1 protein [Thalictrum thalictroides]|uniref:Chup1 protein n=1 Tax=Thalictrum thalictroides TaxID=46969 RepID=A0A7J6VLV3_THATH|nr:Chup1 protein [Thalictrum thalictroides]
MKPLILKAGIPLAVSLASFIYSMITTRRAKRITTRSSEEAQINLDQNELPEEFENRDISEDINTISPLCRVDEHMEDAQTMNSLTTFRIQRRRNLEEEILELMNQVRGLKDTERDLERKFIWYCTLKEQELAFMKLQNILALEQAHVKYLRMTVESKEAEDRRFELMLVGYLRVKRQLENAVLEKGLLQKKVKKLFRTTRKYFNIISQQAAGLRGRETEILTNQEELQGKAHVIVGLNDEIMALKKIVDHLQAEKKELAEKLELEETSASSVSKKGPEGTVADDHDQILAELEQLRAERAAEAEELIYLRWINACFRHELTRNQGQHVQVHEQEEEKHHEKLDHILTYDSDASSTITEHGAFIMTTSHKKPKLLHKFKRWVNGSELCRRSWNEKDHERKYGRIRSVTDRSTEQHLKAHKSCSSA